MFCTLKQPKGKKGGGGDGCTIDTKGNLYITSALGLQVFDPAGKYLGQHRDPRAAGQRAPSAAPTCKTLYVTARTSLYTVPMEATGHQFAGGNE